MQQDFKRPFQKKPAKPSPAEGELPTPIPATAQSIQPESVSSSPSVPVAVNNPPSTADAASSYPARPRSRKSSKAKAIVSALLAFVAIAAIALAAAGVWYFLALEPKDPSASQKRVIIQQGTALSEMADQLEREGVIKDALAFQVYIRLQGLQGRMQAGAYVLSPSRSVQDIVSHIVEGRVNTLRITILPGLTLNDLRDTLRDYGFEPEAVDAALSKQYDHPLLVSKPKSSSLEGYIYPETYDIDASASVENLLTTTFDEFSQSIAEQGIAAQLKSRKLTLHKAVTMASIVQMEVPDPEDQRRVAQVVYKRIKENIPLGMDSTSVYALKQQDLDITPGAITSINSPYNTRINKGLPPGPIANFNLSALVAAANPASTDYLYFVSGDGKYSGMNYFSKTLEEHENNVSKYCQQQCID